MKTITIKQPWASLICSGIKDIENRTWKTKFRGRVLIHASAKPVGDLKNNSCFSHVVDENQLNHLKANDFKNWFMEDFAFSAIIGLVEIVDCVCKTYNSKRDTSSIWALEGQWHWVLANPILFPEPIPAKGKQSFWEYPNILAEPEEKGGELFCHCQLPVKEINQVAGGCGDYRCVYCGGKWYK